MPFKRIFLTSAALFFALVSPLLLHAAEPAPDEAGIQFFETKIRPMLVESCYKCHSAAAKKKGNLLLDSREALLQGGDTSPAIVVGKPEKSLLMEAVGYANVDLQMPPNSKLTAQQIADLSEWIKRGAPWPKSTAAVAIAKSDGLDLEKLKSEHWAWKRVVPQTPPAVKNTAWATSNIDRFILAKLEEKGLTPAAPADKRTLIREPISISSACRRHRTSRRLRG